MCCGEHAGNSTQLALENFYDTVLYDVVTTLTTLTQRPCNEARPSYGK